LRSWEANRFRFQLLLVRNCGFPRLHPIASSAPLIYPIRQLVKYINYAGLKRAAAELIIQL
jgi:hypothetical protein